MLEVYKNPSYTPAKRTKDLLSRMILEEKVGQMCQVDGRFDPENWIFKKHIGSFLHVTGKDVIKLQKIAAETRLEIPQKLMFHSVNFVPFFFPLLKKL
ncbi:hypothetical protein IZY60_06805 [Lutibacter sp. B2]|nr:hypothetical protein [Lutibacter sp. B2]